MSLRQPSGISTPAGPLDRILAEHRVWFESQGREGARAELPACDLHAADLRGLDLRQADLAMANLAGADLSHAKLCGANLIAANFRHATLCDANLSDFDARIASQDHGQAGIPLSGPTILDGADFGGADLTIAKLPLRSAFEEQLQEKLGVCRRALLFAVALGILFVLISFQVAAARDLQLLLPGREAAGILDAITAKYVFLGAAIFSAIGYGAWVFGPLRRICRAGNQLPARMPDGAAIDANRTLWPLNMLAAQWMPLLREDRLDWRGRMPVWLTLAALFAVPPAVAVLVWWRFLAIHEWWSSALLALLAALAIGAACFGWSQSSRSLGGLGEAVGDGQIPVRNARPAVRAAAAVLLSANVLIALSFAVIESHLAPHLAARVDVTFQNLSGYARNVVEASSSAVRGPNLAGRNLRYARISYSSLVNADLRNARLDHAAITVSDLRRADLSGADLREAALFASNLESATLTATDLRGATLHCAVGLTGSQLAAARTDEATILPDGSSGPFQINSDSLAANAEECSHWAPGNAPPIPLEIIQPRSAQPGATPAPGRTSAGPDAETSGGESEQPTEPDLSPIEELKPSRKTPAVEPKE